MTRWGQQIVTGLPENWQVDSTLAFVSPEATRGFHTNIVITSRTAPEKAQLIDVLRHAKMEIVAEKYPGLRLGKEGDCTISGQAAKQIEFFHTVTNPKTGESAELIRRNILCVIEQVQWSITLTAHVQSFTKEKPALDRLLDSIELPRQSEANSPAHR